MKRLIALFLLMVVISFSAFGKAGAIVRGNLEYVTPSLVSNVSPEYEEYISGFKLDGKFKGTDMVYHKSLIEKWNDAYDSALDNERELHSGTVTVTEGNTCECLAIEYADDKVDEYNEELSLSLADLDIEYDTMKCMYDTLLEELRAQQESEKTATSTAAQDTGLLNQ